MTELDVTYSGFSGSLGSIEDIYNNRRRCDYVIASPSITKENNFILLLLLLCHENVYITGPKVIFDGVIDALKRDFGIGRRSFTERLIHLDDSTNPYDDSDQLKQIARNDYLEGDITKLIDISATGILCGTPEGKEVTDRIWAEDPALVDMLPFVGPFLHMRHIWVPMSLRTRYILQRTNGYNLSYSTVDSYEADLHQSIFEFGVRDSELIRQQVKDGSKRISLEMRSYLLAEILNAYSLGSSTPANARSALTRFPHVSLPDIGNFLDSINDNLYKSPYYISLSSIRGTIDTALISYVGGISLSSLKDVAFGTIGNIPLPYSIPNPISLYQIWEGFNQKREIQKEVGWLIYLANIIKARASFDIQDVPKIPGIKKIIFQNDTIYTIAGNRVGDNNTKMLHRAHCSELINVNTKNVHLYMDFARNPPRTHNLSSCHICCQKDTAIP
jgi:hypothetical protein